MLASNNNNIDASFDLAKSGSSKLLLVKAGWLKIEPGVLPVPGAESGPSHRAVKEYNNNKSLKASLEENSGPVLWGPTTCLQVGRKQQRRLGRSASNVGF